MRLDEKIYASEQLEASLRESLLHKSHTLPESKSQEPLFNTKVRDDDRQDAGTFDQQQQVDGPALEADHAEAGDADAIVKNEADARNKAVMAEQAERIEHLESEVALLNSQIAKLQGQLKTAVAEKERQVREKTEIEARLRHEMSEQVKDVRDKSHIDLAEAMNQNKELRRELEELQVSKASDKTSM